MATIQVAAPFVPRRASLSGAWRRNPPLTALIGAMLLVLTVSLVGLVVDPRIITGAPAWMKPAKFALSIAIYGITLLWMLTFLRDRPRLVAAISWSLAAGFSIEMALIVMQVLRGTTSHFNQATPFDSAVFRAMGATIAVMWLLNAVVAAILCRRRFGPAAIVWGVRLGLVVSLIGMAVAFLMIAPTTDQRALIVAGSSPIVGAHAVGVPDGGPGLPLVGWSTHGGDLRVAHFVGLHALQGLPLLAVLLTRFAPSWLSMRDRSRLVGIAAADWTALTLLLAWQALRGQPLIAPDGLTLIALAALVIGTVTAAGAVVARSARARSSPLLTVTG